MSAIGTMLGSLAASAGSQFISGSIGNFFSGRKMLRQYQYQRKLQEQAANLNYNYSLQSAENLPQAQRTGLENAGYNPLLALGGMNASGGFTSAGSAGIATGDGIASDAYGDARDAYKVFHQQERLNNKTIDSMDSQIDNTNANTFLAEQQAETEVFKRRQMESQTFLNNINYELSKKDLDWKDRLNLMQEKTGYLQSQAHMLNAQAQINNATTAEKMYKLQGALSVGEKEKANVEKEYYQKYGNLHKFGMGSQEVLPSLGAALGIGAGAGVAGRFIKGMFKRPVGFSTR